MKLIIVENIGNPFRCVFESLALRRRILSELAQRFLKIAYEYDVAVVFTNEMTKSKTGELLPSLGKRIFNIHTFYSQFRSQLLRVHIQKRHRHVASCHMNRQPLNRRAGYAIGWTISCGGHLLTGLETSDQNMHTFFGGTVR